jgi:thioredoxin 1
MNETTEPSSSSPAVRYELLISEEEARSGTTKLLPRNQKRLQVNIPAGVASGSLVKLSNALQITDGRAGDILIEIKIKSGESGAPQREFPGVIEISDSTFEDEVLHAPLPAVVDFWAPWCGPCRMMAPVMETAAVRYQGKFKFFKINVDENPVAASQYQATNIPMLLVFKNGQEIDRNVGAIPEPQLCSRLDALL